MTKMLKGFWVVLFVAIAWGAMGQVQFRTTFNCDSVQGYDSREFREFMKARYSNPLKVYSYMELAPEQFSLCGDSTIFFHVQYGLLFEKFLINKNSVKAAEAIYNNSKRSAEQIAVIALKEIIYQNYYNGKFYQLDSLIDIIPWSRYSEKSRSELALNIYLCMGTVLIEPERVALLRKSISEKDTVLKWIETGWRNPRFGDQLIQMYRSGEIIVGNMAITKSFMTLISKTDVEAAAEKIKPIKDLILEFGFKQSVDVLGRMYLEIHDRSDYYLDVLKYSPRKKSASSYDWKDTAMIVVLVLSMGWLVYSIVRLVIVWGKRRSLKKWILNEIEMKIDTARILKNTLEKRRQDKND